LHITQEEQCYVDYYDKALALHNHSLPNEFNDIINADEFFELIKCINLKVEDI
jgi:hypothetical protein